MWILFEINRNRYFAVRT